MVLNSIDPPDTNHKSPGAAEDMPDDPREMVHFKIRSFGDFVTISEKNSCASAKSSTKISDFLNHMSTKFQVPAEDVELVYQEKSTGNIFHFSKLADTMLYEVGITPSTSVLYSLSLEKKRRKPKKLCFDDLPDEIIDTAGAQPSGSTSLGDIGENLPRKHPRDYTVREFVGLKNQSSTCYLNSLLQALFFCPEFRNCLYLHKFKYDPNKKSVGTALQQLFLKLQFSNRWAIETESITRTFGWKEDEYTVQHDIEELYRVLMDALDDEFKSSHSYSITESLFAGIMNDYVECLKCHTRNAKKTFFTALHLPVRLFDRPLPEPTLESSLRNFVTAELLCEKNQYKCDNCDELVDAHKGLSLEKLPYFMCILLQRSEFDFESMSRKKCCDRLTFPDLLNMNQFVDAESSQDHTPTVHAIDIKDIRGEKYDAHTRTSHSRPHVTLTQSGELQIKDADEKEKEKIKMLETGPNVYQLLSILIHRGRSSLAGHYYAYCLDLETRSWNMFNDSSVHKIHPEEILEAYGGESAEQSGMAYMLIYRRVEREKNSLPLTLEELPQEIKDIWMSFEREEQELITRETIENEIIRLSIYCRDSHCWEPREKEIVLTKADSLSANAVKCYKEFFGDQPVSIENLRLARYDQRKGVMDMTFDDNDDTTLGSHSRILRGALMLEVKPPGVEFINYTTSDIVFKTHFVNSKNDTVGSFKEIHATLRSTVGDLKRQVSQYFEKPPRELALILEGRTTRVDLTSVGDENELSSLDMESGNCYDLFVEDRTFSLVSSLGNFVENYYNSVQFDIVCELNTHEATGETSSSDINGYASNGDELDLANVPERPFSPASTAKEGSMNSTACTDASQNVLDMGIDLDTLSDSTNASVKNGVYYFRVLEEKKSSNGCKALLVKAEKDMSLEYLSREIHAKLEVGEAELVVYKILDGIEDEILNYSQSLSDIHFDSLKVTQGHRLRTNETRAHVFLLDLKAITDNSAALFDVVFNTSTTVKDFRGLVDRAIVSVPDVFDDSKCYRLRKKNLSNPSRIMKDSQMVHEYLSRTCCDVFLQPISHEFASNDGSEDSWHSMMLFLWKPSELALLPPVEIMFKYDYTVSLEALLANQISDQCGVPKADLEVARPESDFPCNLNPIVIQEKLEWFRLDNTTRKHIAIHNDEGILFVRNKSEPMRTLGSDERSLLEKEAMAWRGEYTIPIPKKKVVDREIGLKINLARSPPILK